MPQATHELRERWKSDFEAFRQLANHVKVSRGIIYPKEGYEPTDDDFSAINYLCQEWDFGYSANN